MMVGIQTASGQPSNAKPTSQFSPPCLRPKGRAWTLNNKAGVNMICSQHSKPEFSPMANALMVATGCNTAALRGGAARDQAEAQCAPVSPRQLHLCGTTTHMTESQGCLKPPPAYEPILCDQCETPLEEIGPDAFGNEWYCPKCKEYFVWRILLMTEQQ